MCFKSRVAGDFVCNLREPKMDNTFSNRINAFRFGYQAFFDNIHDNFYNENGTDDEWFQNREWQAGYNLAYADHQDYWGGKNNAQ